MNRYWYKYLHQRGRSIACQPNGYVAYDDKAEEYGTIAYDRELTAKEVNDYELRPLYKERVCGKCKLNQLFEDAALSRRDNETEICDDCATEEAFEDIGLI